MYLLVIDSSFEYLPESLKNYRNDNSIVFNDFTPNPLYEDVVKGVILFNKNHCQEIVAIGGGSTIDVAKCIKLFATLDPNTNYLNQEFKENNIKLTAIPTTAGTGSETTKYAVIYYEGNKQSITHDSIIPSCVKFEPNVLGTLPLYQKKATMLDALCHGIESYWSVNSNEESKKYAKEVINIIVNNYQEYLNNNKNTFELMFKAANLAGKAINITQTTAGHAMCYKLTSLYGIAHGHSAALCIKHIYPYIVSNTDKCIDYRGKNHLNNTLKELQGIISIDKYLEIMNEMNLNKIEYKESDLEALTDSVNTTRLKNFPIELDKDSIKQLYVKILGE